MTRAQLFDLICNLVGQPQCTSVVPGSGWPGLADVLLLNGKKIRVALHVSRVGSHSRKAYEMRFQNPGDSAPVKNPSGAIPILVGFAQVGQQPILVAVDGASRVNRQARFSILFRDELLKTAAADGWAEYYSSSHERIFAFHPKLFGVFVDAMRAGVFPRSEEVAQASAASGVLDDNTDVAAERTRAVASRLVRDARFSRDVRKAYKERCAMCSLSLGLVVGAHIFPASAPQSPDKVWNGLALCHNHHAAFDKHFIWVDPNSHDVKIRPDILEFAEGDTAAHAFTSNTRASIILPSAQSDRPQSGMFDKRYEFYQDQYEWL